MVASVMEVMHTAGLIPAGKACSQSFVRQVYAAFKRVNVSRQRKAVWAV